MATAGKKRRRSVVDLHNREVGGISPRIFAHRASAAEDLVLRLQIHKKLERHSGCVNTVSFNTTGDILVSGSDDMMVMLWDWDAAVTKLVFDSGHIDNVFHAQFMPFTGDRTIITCGADGQVRRAQILEDGNVATKLLAQHEGPAHKMDIEPGSPHIFYSCGEDGVVQHFDLREESPTRLFTCKSFQDKTHYMPIVNLNAIAVDLRNPNLFVVAGSDEYARVYDIRKYNWDGSNDFGHSIDCFCPPHLIGNELVTITGLAFSDQSELLVSYSPEFIYLFTREQGLGSNTVSAFIDSDREADTREASASVSACSSSSDASASSGPRAYKDHINKDTVKGVSFFGRNSEYVASGSDCGHIFIWRKKDGELLRAMEGDKYVVNCVVPHPYDTTIASSGIENNIKIWTPSSKERAQRVDFLELKQRIRVKYSHMALFEYDSDESGSIFYSDVDSSNSEDDDDLSGSHGNEDFNNDGDLLDPCDEDDNDEPLWPASSTGSEE